MPTDEGIDVVKDKYDANLLAKQEAERAAKLAAQKAAADKARRIAEAQKAKEIAEQRAQDKLAAQKIAQQTKNVPTVLNQEIINNLRIGDTPGINLKTVLDANPGLSQLGVGQTVNIPTIRDKGNRDPLNQSGTGQPTSMYPEMPLGGTAGASYTGYLKEVEKSGYQNMNMPDFDKTAQRVMGTYEKPTGLAAMDPALVQKQRDYIKSMVPQGHVPKSPEELQDI